MKVDKIYVLCLNPTQERIDDIKKRLELCEFEESTSYDILPGHDGWNSPLPEWASIYEGWALGGNNPFWKLPVQPGEVGCTLSHINAWKLAAEHGYKRTLILEEDFTPTKTMSSLPEPNPKWPLKWDYLSLGRWIFNIENDIRLDDTYCIPSLHYNMQAYILTDVGAQKLVDYKLENNIFINDEFITATYMDHPREDINKLYPIKTITAIATHDDWFNQNGSSNKVSSHAPQGGKDSRKK